MHVLSRHGHECRVFDAGASLVSAVTAEFCKPFDLVILDAQLCDGSGYETMKRLHSDRKPNMPVIFVAQDARESDIVRALAGGAEDYLIHPVRERELLARIHNVVRDAAGADIPLRNLQIGELRADALSMTLHARSQIVKLTALEFNLLSMLASHAGATATRARLSLTCWGHEAVSDSRAVDMAVSKLRAKLHAMRTTIRIHTVRGVGYLLTAESPASDGGRAPSPARPALRAPRQGPPGRPVVASAG
jgi:DNA-binding response OmpR family regulator